MKLQKVVENSQNKENVDDSGGFIVFQTHQRSWLSFPLLK